MFESNNFNQQPSESSIASYLQSSISHIQSIAKIFQHFHTHSEKEFLKMGTNLQDFHAQATEITDEAKAVTDVIASGNIGNTEKLNRYIDHSIAKNVQAEEGLKRITKATTSIFEALEGFTKSVKLLHIFGLSSKIETSRLGTDDNGFHVLAGNIENMADILGSKIKELIAEVKKIDVHLSRTLQSLHTIKYEEQDESRQLLEKMNGDLEVLKQKQQESKTASGRIIHFSENIHSSIGHVVMSLQFHDITRQQLEHVGEALEQVEVGVSTSQAESMQLAGDILSVSELQLLQLKNTKQEIESAIDTLFQQLRQIGNNIEEMTQETIRCTTSSDFDNRPFLTGIEHTLAELSSTLINHKAVVQDFLSTISSLSELLDNLSNFVDDIEELGAEIELIAVNAQIKAAGIGKQGAALGVLAEEIHNLAIKSSEQTGMISKHLKQIHIDGKDLYASSSKHATDAELDLDVIIQESRNLLASHQEVQTATIDMLNGITEKGKKLVSRIEFELDHATLHAIYKSAIEESMACLEAIIADAKKHNIVADKQSGRIMQEMVARYTMQNERALHEAHMKGEAPAVPDAAAAAKETVAEDSEFGENVDLF